MICNMSSAPLVFVVDEDPHSLSGMCSQIEKLGYRAQGMHSGEQCLAELTLKKPDLILMALALTGMRGDDCCQKIKENPEWSTLPVIMLTSPEAPHEVMYCWRSGASDFLHKPTSLGPLRGKLEAILNAQTQDRFDQFAGKTMLLVEDTRFYRNVIGATLESAGCRVLYAVDANEALELAKANAGSIDVCLIDLVLPQSRGTEVIRALRALQGLERVPMLVMSGSEPLTGDVLQEVRELTNDALLDKRMLPYDAILSKVNSSLQKQTIELKAAARVPFFSLVEFSDDGVDWRTGYSYNVSPRGIFIRTVTPFAASKHVQVRLTVPGTPQPLMAEGDVVWANPYRKNAAYTAPVGMGILLSQMELRLQWQVEQLMAPTQRRVNTSAISPE
jgi:two-component system, cell cycle response regulator